MYVIRNNKLKNLLNKAKMVNKSKMIVKINEHKLYVSWNN